MPFGTYTVQRTDHIGTEVLRSVCHAIKAARTGKITGNNGICTVHIGKSTFIVGIRTDSGHTDNIGFFIGIRYINTAHFVSGKGMMSQLNASRTGIRIRTDSNTAGNFVRIFRQSISSTEKSGFIKIIRCKTQSTFLFTAAVQDFCILTDSDTRQIQAVCSN